MSHPTKTEDVPHGEPMKFAYADPPYLGCCSKYGHNHADWGCFDDWETHGTLIDTLYELFPDGWAMSLSSPSMEKILPLLCEEPHHVGAWVKSFASFKPNVNPGYCWEPVVFVGGRKLGRDVETVRDFIVEPITLEKGLTGAKPPNVCRWIARMLGYQPGDELVDLFPSTGVMGRVLAQGVLL